MMLGVQFADAQNANERAVDEYADILVNNIARLLRGETTVRNQVA
jgi:hypothetical protein